MPQTNRRGSLIKSRREIAGKVRRLRNERGWTQTDLAKRLQLSQNRLSEIERGSGSFTAEQFLLILRLFNVPVSDFVSEPGNRALEIQNALARLGAGHLQESAQVLPTKDLEDASDVVREALLEGSPRFITALAPVLVRHAERLSLAKLYAELEKVGHERRLPWVVENTLLALDSLASSPKPQSREWSKVRRRAEVPFKMFLDLAADRTQAQNRPSLPPDVLDATIRSRRTVEEVQRSASRPSARWQVITSIRPEDFEEALRASRVSR